MKNMVTNEVLAGVFLLLLSYSSMAYVNSKHAEAVSMIRLNESKIQGLHEMLGEVRDDVKDLHRQLIRRKR